MLPSWLKPPRWIDRDADEAPGRHDLSREPHRPVFLREVAGWDPRWQRMLFQVMVPVQLLVSLGVDPVDLTDADGRSVAFSRVGADGSSFRLEVYPTGDARDPFAELELIDTPFNQIEVVWLALQDPRSPRFDIDVMPNGAETHRGVLCRNLVAEEAAKAAGLAPGQIRGGLRSFRWVAERIENLMLCLNQRDFIAQPLYYHTAILFEQYGFGYLQGQSRLEEIAQDFAPGGKLRRRLDGSTPFRLPEQADSVRGRSWAIHDGILDEPWDRVRMVKRLGASWGINTCPGVPW